MKSILSSVAKQPTVHKSISEEILAMRRSACCFWQRPRLATGGRGDDMTALAAMCDVQQTFDFIQIVKGL